MTFCIHPRVLNSNHRKSAFSVRIEWGCWFCHFRDIRMHGRAACRRQATSPGCMGEQPAAGRRPARNAMTGINRLLNCMQYNSIQSFCQELQWEKCRFEVKSWEVLLYSDKKLKRSLSGIKNTRNIDNSFNIRYYYGKAYCCDNTVQWPV